MSSLLWALGATFIVSLMSFIGVFTLALSEKKLNKLILLMVSFSAGALLGGAFLHLIPEAAEELPGINVFLYVLVGFSLFFLIEKFLYWRHCHKGKCDVHTFSYMNLIGDGVHNFIDGMIIAASFIISVPLGITTTAAIISHEIPQEIGDFGVLVYGGFTKAKALLSNFMTALTALLGVIVGYVMAEVSTIFVTFLLPFAAGGFIYIAASDLVPELHKEKNIMKSLYYFIFFLIGIAFMYGVKIMFKGF